MYEEGSESNQSKYLQICFVFAPRESDRSHQNQSNRVVVDDK